MVLIETWSRLYTVRDIVVLTVHTSPQILTIYHIFLHIGLRKRDIQCMANMYIIFIMKNTREEIVLHPITRCPRRQITFLRDFNCLRSLDVLKYIV